MNPLLRTLLAIVGTLLFLQSNAFALDPSRDIRQYGLRRYGVGEGLPSVEVRALAQRSSDAAREINALITDSEKSSSVLAKAVTDIFPPDIDENVLCS